ncbi:DUF4232 domain-containing protein [Streptomyces sp. NBC_00083]|uniref:DUF4232 domain-containing protein n=1 Tax=Streptomyces sp. NBC_00083 TaxID=2975647 RepID=UPI00225C2B0E|nr:DUF4232 domain-containing protein [Streptomyces sp. NBC_00083]MCX5384891.1 DUF4232 domain-containing protein [Streptomyces sp. NBC_00083]
MRTTFRIAAAATSTLVAALALTACGGDGSDGSTSAEKPAASTPVDTPATPGQTPAGDSKGSGTGTGSGKSAGSSSGGHTGSGSGSGSAANPGGKSAKKPSGGGSSDASCTGATVKLTATPVTRPINHVLLTVTNTGSTRCNAYYAPSVAFFGDQQSPVAVDKDTIPQAVVSLSPGASAYAMVRTQGEDDGSKPRNSTRVSVYFQGKDDNGSTGSAAHASLTKSIAVVESQAMVTYWQSDLSTIDSW